MTTNFPRWVDPNAKNLREVAPNLYIGAESSPDNHQWALVIDLYGSSARYPQRYRGASDVIRIPFNDGDGFPPGSLDTIFTHVRRAIGRGPVLIHCQAGLSRSASAAYAMMRAIWGLPHEEALRRVKMTPYFPMPNTLASARDWVGKRTSRLHRR